MTTVSSTKLLKYVNEIALNKQDILLKLIYLKYYRIMILTILEITNLNYFMTYLKLFKEFTNILTIFDYNNFYLSIKSG